MERELASLPIDAIFLRFSFGGRWEVEEEK